MINDAPANDSQFTDHHNRSSSVKEGKLIHPGCPTGRALRALPPQPSSCTLSCFNASVLSSEQGLEAATRKGQDEGVWSRSRGGREDRAWGGTRGGGGSLREMKASGETPSDLATDHPDLCPLLASVSLRAIQRGAE